MPNEIKNVLLIFSGKGGVGKSTVATNLAVALSQKGLRVGLLDADIHGPNLALMLGVQDKEALSYGEDLIMPIEVNENLFLISVSYLIPETDTPIIWRGPAKMKLIEKFVNQIDWGDLDYLIVDAPPGTGDEPLSIAQLLPGAKAVVITTPQDVSLLDSMKAINFAKKLKLEIVGLIENMSGYKCPHCGKIVDLFKSGGGEKIAQKYGIPFLGAIPIDPKVVISGDNGCPIVKDNDSSTAKIFLSLADIIIKDK